MNTLIMLVSIAILSQVHGNVPSSISCISKNCYTAFEITTDFQKALEMCKETQRRLITVRSNESNDAIRDLFTDIKGEFWIGLQFNDKGCTDISLELRRYEWITGDTLTGFTNWRNNENVCTPKCVSVSRDLKWTEKPCHDNADGFLCENDFVCEPLVPTEAGESFEYTTLLGIAGKGSLSFPPGSQATTNPSGVRHICAPGLGWLRAPWSCQVEEGGCQHKCVMHGGAQCVCPPGQALQSNGVACAITSNDPCLTMGCAHICMPSGSCLCEVGYELREDGKGCRDIDECRDEIICQSSKCVNTMGSYECHCPDGFKKENGGPNCVDIDECFLSPCEHVCENTRGSYTCSCFEGYLQRRDDHRKCKMYCGKKECEALCDINDPTKCVCPDGYIMDKPQDIRLCVDIDECRFNYCTHGCANTFGGYICSCPVGFRLIEKYRCEEHDSDEGSGFTTPSVTVTPTSNYTTEITSAMTPGGLLGIMVCIVLMILIIVFLVHHISKRRSSWKVVCVHKNQGEDLQDLQQVTTQKYTKKSSFVNRDLKQET